MCYGNIKEAYRSLQKPPVGTSDHFAVQLLPTYRQKLKQDKVKQRTVQVWSSEATQSLQGCFAMAHNSIEKSNSG